MIRSLRPTDILSVLAHGSPFSNYVRTGDCLGGERPPASLTLSLLGQFVYLRKLQYSWAWIEQNEIRGLLTIRQRSGPSAWEISGVYLDQRLEKIGFNLLDSLAMTTETLPISRFFMRLPQDSGLLETARQTGFSLYASQRLYELSPRSRELEKPITAGVSFRRKFPGDDFQQFQIYSRIVPERIRASEGMTFEEWRESRERVLRGTSYFCEREGKAIGWVNFRKRCGKVCLEIVASEGDEPVLKEILSWAVAAAAPAPEIHCLVYAHQTRLCRLLEDRGFEAVKEHSLFAREQVVRVKEPYLVPAGLSS